MLKNSGYGGVYTDENISVGVLLENPLKCGLEETDLVFSINLRIKKGNSTTINLEDFVFYILDESNCFYNTRSISYPKEIIDLADADEEIRQPDALIATHFKHSFLFQDLRIAFYYRPYQRINIIKLKH